MRVVVVGLGVQGTKRQRVAGASAVATVDPVHPDADYRELSSVPLDDYDAALLCVPDAPKLVLMRWLAERGKHFLVEKPVLAADTGVVEALIDLARANGVTCYTAYNHRFEPHIVSLRDEVRSGSLGEIYRARFFYGNGTARDVRNSVWRDRGAGVLPDLASHLLDTILFLLDGVPAGLEIWAAKRFENRAFDHVICGSRDGRLVELEISLLSWRNHFIAELVGEHGSATIESLCKWGPSTLTVRKRLLPSGRPTEAARTLVQPDPTWELEWAHFCQLCAAGDPGNLANDIVINRVLIDLAAQAGVELLPENEKQ
jgi:scyllo-inositol 2-dehydrogenase (NADP+)